MKREIIERYGFEISEEEWKTIENKEDFCEQCYDGSYFPAFKCRGCWFFNQKNSEHVFCMECIHCKSDSEAFFGLKCTLTGSHPAWGYGCSKGKKRS